MKIFKMKLLQEYIKSHFFPLNVTTGAMGINKKIDILKQGFVERLESVNV